MYVSVLVTMQEIQSQEETKVVLYVLGMPSSWQLKVQRSLILSSSEAEWVVLSETAKGVMFMVKLLQSLKMSVELPVIIRIKNVGTIYIMGKVSATSHIKHEICMKNMKNYCR